MVIEAGRAILDLWPGSGTGRELSVKRKSDGSAVTEADLLSHEIISKRLAKLFPDDFLLSEEAPDDAGFAKANTAWILDPLDCTEAYIRGDDHFAIFLSRRQAGQITEAYLYYPALQDFVMAKVGKGTFLNGMKINCNSSGSLRTQSLYTEALPLAPAPHLCGQGRYPVGTRAIVALSRGEIDGLLIRQTSGRIFAWDWAPMGLIVSESGGVLTDGSGKTIDFSTNPIDCSIIAAAAKRLHKEVLGLIPA